MLKKKWNSIFMPNLACTITCKTISYSNMFLLNGVLFTATTNMLFVSCKRNVLFDIFNGMLIDDILHVVGLYRLHQILAHLRLNFRVDSYCNPSYSFYEEVYKV